MSPLASTSNTPRPVAQGYGARLGDLLLRLVHAPGREGQIATGDLEAPPVNTGQLPEEFGTAFGKLFARSDFTGGEGLDFAHRRDAADSDARRFYASKGINIADDDPSDLRGFCLLHDTAEVQDSANTNLHLAHDGTAVYLADGTSVLRSTDSFATETTEDPTGADPNVAVNDLTAHGEDVWAACGAQGVRRRDGGAGTWSRWDSGALTNVLKVWVLKNFVLVANGTALLYVASGGAGTTLITLTDGNTWLDAADAGAAVLVAADDGWIYSIGDDGSGGLELKGQTFIGDEEVPYSLGAKANVVIFATRQANHNSGAIARLYLAELNPTTFTLQGPGSGSGIRRLRTWGTQASTTDWAPRRILVSRDSAWIGINDSTTAQVWRYHFGNAGISRDMEAAVAGTVVDMLMIQNRLLFSVSGQGLYREATTYVNDGWLIGPLGDHFTAERKPWVGALLNHKSVTSDSRIELWHSTDPAAIADPDHSTWVRIKNVKSGRDETESGITNLEGRFIAGMVRVYATSANTATPRVYSFAFRSYPPEPDQLVELVVNLSDSITRRGYRPITIPGLGKRTYDALKGKEGKYDVLGLYATGETLQGTVESVRQPLMSEAATWPMPVAFVRFRGRRSAMVAATNADGGMGIGTMGIMSMGGTDS